MHGIRHWWALLLISSMISSLLSVVGCDSANRAYEDLRLARLTEGTSTEQDVRQLFGEPSATRTLEGGKGLVYPLGPEGPHTLLLRFDATGTYRGRTNLLTRENFGRIGAGQRQSEVFATLGPPGRTERYSLKQQTASEWRFLDDNATRVFVVTFDASGTVVSSAIEEDPRQSGGR